MKRNEREREDVRPKLLPKLPRQQLKNENEFKDNNRNFESPFSLPHIVYHLKFRL